VQNFYAVRNWKAPLMHAYFSDRRNEARFSINDKRRRICNAYAAESNLSAVAHYKPLSGELAWFQTSNDSVNRNNKRQLIIGILTIDEKQPLLKYADR